MSETCIRISRPEGRPLSEHFRLLAAVGGEVRVSSDQLRALAQLSAQAEAVIAQREAARAMLERVGEIHAEAEVIRASGLRLVAARVRLSMSMGDLWCHSVVIALFGAAMLHNLVAGWLG